VGAATTLALTALDVLTDEAQLARVKEAHAGRATRPRPRVAAPLITETAEP
jgi:hypothetical protein